MRPYEIGLRKQRTKGQNTSLLEKRDDIFFLDDNYKELKIYSEAWEGYRTLGEVWEDYNAGALRGISQCCRTKNTYGLYEWCSQA